MRPSILTTVLRVMAVVLVLRVLGTILANYPDYFPPNFDSLFFEGREGTFHGTYRLAFYVHILSAPVVLVNGLVLMSTAVLRNARGLHRWLGRVQVAVLLTLMLPSGMVMARHAFSGWPAGISFFTLSLATAGCAVVGTAHVIGRRFDRHRVWMTRCYVLVCSAVALRLISGAAGLVGVPDPEAAYAVAAWVSWLGPLAVCVAVQRGSGAVRAGPRTMAVSALPRPRPESSTCPTPPPPS